MVRCHITQRAAVLNLIALGRFIKFYDDAVCSHCGERVLDHFYCGGVFLCNVLLLSEWPTMPGYVCVN